TSVSSRDREAETTEGDLVAELTRLDAEVIAAESALVAAGGQDLAEALGRCESLRERARGQVALIAERRRRIERVRAEELGTEVIATLEAEAAAIADELAGADTEEQELAAMAAELDVAEADLETARRTFATRWEEPDTTRAHRAGEVRT